MFGVIDIGSNTIRLTLYKETENGLKLVLNKKHMTGLAGYVDAKGYLTESGIRKAIYDLLDFKLIIENIELKALYVFATASLRNIRNTDEAMSRIKEMTGFDIDLISGEMEARLDFLGATQVMPLKNGILIDIGGGSTELVYFTDGSIDKAISMPMGSLSLYKKFVADIIPTPSEIKLMKAYVKEEIKKVDLEKAHPVICGVGGSIRGALKLCNEVYGNDYAQGRIDPKQLKKMLKCFSDDKAFAVQNIIKTVPDRMHTIIPGLTILNTLCKKHEALEIYVSPYGIREGYLYTKLEK